MTYRLSGGSRDELQRYVNSRVEITGTMQNGSDRNNNDRNRGDVGVGTGTATASGSGNRTPQIKEKSGTTAGDNQPTTTQTLRVTSVRQLEGSCVGG